MSAIGILRSFAEARSADHEPIPARLTYGTLRRTGVRITAARVRMPWVFTGAGAVRRVSDE